MFLCLKCRSCGTWQDLKDILSLAKSGERRSISSVLPDWLPTEKELEPVVKLYDSAIPISEFNDEKRSEIGRIYGIQMVKLSTLEKYEARLTSDLSKMLFPIHSVNNKIVGVQLIHAKRDDGQSVDVEVIPRHLTGVLFGWKQLNRRQDNLIIAGSLIDALIIAQETGLPVVSLPQDKTLPLETLPLLEPFSKIILWLGSDIVSWQLAKMFARKLNDRRCFFIRPEESHPAPKDALESGVSITGILKSAHPVAHTAITTFQTLRREVLAELAQIEQVAGVKWKRYPLLNKLLKGHRRGELTVFTGPTGSGKTTFMSEYSLDLCMQGVRTLWGSFEIRNIRLAKMMITQYALTPLHNHLDQYNHWADLFEKLPLYFLTFHGPQNIRSVLDAMRHAVYVHDIEHVVVDNLQFMLGNSESPNILDRFWKQDLVISQFRQFATVHNCHVSLVIHPRKENSDELNMMSIFGGAKASQEADNVLILQDRRLGFLKGRKFVQVMKNRFDGDLGIIPLQFDKETLSFVIKTKPKNVVKSSTTLKNEADRSESPKGTKDVEE